MVTIAPPRKDWSEAFQEIGKGASEGYQQRSDQMAIQKAVEALPANHTPQQLLGALTKVKTYNPQASGNFLKNWARVEEISEGKRKSLAQESQTNRQLTTQEAGQKETGRHNLAAEELTKGSHEATKVSATEKTKQAEIKAKESADKRTAEQTAKQAADEAKAAKKAQDEADKLQRAHDEASNFYKRTHPEATEEEVQSAVKGSSPENERALAALQAKKNAPSALEKKRELLAAEEMIDLEQSIPQMQDNLKNIDRAEELSKSLGLFGINTLAPLSGYIGTKAAKELDAVSFPLLAPIIKIFNPVGAIATRKIDLVKDHFHIRSTDWPWQIQGKLNAERRYQKQALARAEQKLALYKQYNGVIPIDVQAKLSIEDEAQIDMMDAEGEVLTNNKLPAPEKYDGNIITDANGKEYYSDGKTWRPYVKPK